MAMGPYLAVVTLPLLEVHTWSIGRSKLGFSAWFLGLPHTTHTKLKPFWQRRAKPNSETRNHNQYVPLCRFRTTKSKPTCTTGLIRNQNRNLLEISFFWAFSKSKSKPIGICCFFQNQNHNQYHFFLGNNDVIIPIFPPNHCLKWTKVYYHIKFYFEITTEIIEIVVFYSKS